MEAAADHRFPRDRPRRLGDRERHLEIAGIEPDAGLNVADLHPLVGAIVEAPVAEVERQHLVVIGEAEDRSVHELEAEHPAALLRTPLEVRLKIGRQRRRHGAIGPTFTANTRVCPP
jgi:hypothetical protein